MIERTLFEISVSESNGIPVLAVHGRLTIGDPAEQLHTTLTTAVEHRSAKAVINLNDVPQIDSSGISAVVRISIELARGGGALHLVCGPGRVREALSVTRLVEVIPTFDTEAKAVAAFG